VSASTNPVAARYIVGRRFPAVNEEGVRMAIKSIVEMKAKPGRRDELLSTLQQMQMSAVDAPGFIAAEHYRNVEDEDTVIGIYDWTSNEERLAWSQSLDPGTREQLMEVLATPMRIVLADHIE
jgi:heme-degrading monooxygenase HmoA